MKKSGLYSIHQSPVLLLHCHQYTPFHKKCENTGKILKNSRVRCHFMKFDIYFFGLS